ncbi:MAG: efflux RND transporter periplasmic adaptor subunit [Campylobacterota bacterium]|nr:efflux RND transporter periplasmic adaptor subunit [Campylobacterota bacterium]
MRKLILGIWLLVTTLSANEIYATFNIEATKNAKLAFSSSGIVKDVLVDIGSVIKKGDSLATLENDDLKAMLNISKTAVKYAKLDYDRQLKVKHMIDKSKFDQYAYKYENAKAQLKYQQSLFNKTILKSPFDGVIYEKLIESGDVVSGQMITVVLKIQSKNKRKLVLEFDQKYHSSIKIGDTFNYKIDGDKKQYKGTISKVYPYVNSKTRKIKAEVETKDFIVGLFGDGYITTTK